MEAFLFLTIIIMTSSVAVSFIIVVRIMIWGEAGAGHWSRGTTRVSAWRWARWRGACACACRTPGPGWGRNRAASAGRGSSWADVAYQSDCTVFCVLYCTVLYWPPLSLHQDARGRARGHGLPPPPQSAAQRRRVCPQFSSSSIFLLFKYFYHLLTSGSWRSSKAALSTTCPSPDSSVLTWSRPPSITVKKGNFKRSNLLCHLSIFQCVPTSL